MQHALWVNPGNRPATRADGMHINHWHCHRESANTPFPGQRNFSIDQGHIGRGATHIQGHQP